MGDGSGMDMMEIRRMIMGLMTGGAEEGMKLVRTYTVPVSWEDLTYGNTEYVYNTILKDLVEANTAFNTYVAVFENNTATPANYRADYMVATGFSTNLYFASIRNSRATYATAVNTTRQFYASQGTTVKVYALY